MESALIRLDRMFDVGTPELLTVAVIALLAMGPERLPEAIRNLARSWNWPDPSTIA